MPGQVAEAEKQYRTAVEAEDAENRREPDGEVRELAGLQSRASVAEIVAGAMSGGQPEGATRELQKHHNLAGNQVPLSLLVDRQQPEDPDLQKRTSGVTPGPTSGPAMQQPVIPFVFPESAAAFLQIPQPTVPAGEAVYTVVSTAATPGKPAEGADQDHSAGALTASVLTPSRIQASLFFSIEDRARVPQLDAALRENLSAALADELDETVIDDLLTGSTLSQIDASAADTFETYRSRFAFLRVDGTYASDTEALRLVIGSATLASMAAKFRGTASDVDAYMSLKEITAGVRVSAHVPGVTSNKQPGVVRRGSRMDAVTAMWQGVELLEDRYTQTKAGEVVLTATMLYAHQVLRTAGFARVEAQHA